MAVWAWALRAKSRSRSTFMVPPSPDSSSNWMSPGSMSSANWSASAFSVSACWVYVARSATSSSFCSWRNFLSAGVRARLAGAFAGALAGALAGLLVGVFADRAGAFVAFTALVVPRARAAVFGGGAVTVRVRLRLAVVLAAAVRRPVVVLVLRAVVLAAFAAVLRPPVPRAAPRAGCFALDRVALGMADHRLPGKGCGTVPHELRYLNEPSGID